MTKTIPEIDDAMIDRALKSNGWRKPSAFYVSRDAMRDILTAALTPEPEIEVTEAQKDAALKMWFGAEDISMWSKALRNDFANVYRAMAKAAPKGAKSAPQGVNAGAPEKATGGAVGAVVLLDDAERKALVSLLQQSSALRRERRRPNSDRRVGPLFARGNPMRRVGDRRSTDPK